MPNSETWMDLEIVILNEVRVIWYPLYAESKRKDTNERIYKRKTDLERIYGYQWGRDRLGIWDGHVYTAIFKIGNQQWPIV